MQVQTIPEYDYSAQGHYITFYDTITGLNILGANGRPLETNCFEHKFDAVKQAKKIVRKIEKNDRFYASLSLDYEDFSESDFYQEVREGDGLPDHLFED